jgi:hypothetical protein
LNKLVGMLGCGEVPERLKGTDCKSVDYVFAGSNPALATILRDPFILSLSKDVWRAILLKVWLTFKKKDGGVGAIKLQKIKKTTCSPGFYPALHSFMQEECKEN